MQFEFKGARLSKAFYREIFTGWIILGPILIALVGLGGSRLGEFVSVLAEDDVRSQGIRATEVKVSGDVRASFPIVSLGLIKFYEHDLRFEYRDIHGSLQNASLKFQSFHSSDLSSSPMIWYMPDRSAPIAVSWALEARTARLINSGFYVLVGLAVLILVFRGLFTSLKKIQRYRNCLSRGQLQTYEAKIEPLIDQQTGKESEIKSYFYLVKRPSGEFSLEHFMGRPLLLDRGRTSFVLGLVDPMDLTQKIIFSESLYEFDLSEEDKAKLIQKGRELLLTPH